MGLGKPEIPVDTTYYDLLEISTNATSSEIKRQYYVQAIKHHPDKNPGNPDAESLFKQISKAYQVLSDPNLRSVYDQHGLEAETVAQREFVDAEKVLKDLFGGDRFAPIIGEISLIKLLNQDTEDINPHETRSNIQKTRVEDLLSNLVAKTREFVLDLVGEGEFRSRVHQEAFQLAEESYGPELLGCIGYVYLSKANSHIHKDRFMGLASLWYSLREKAHVVSVVVDTIHAFRDMARETKAQSQEPEERKEEKIKTLLWKGSNLDIESTLRRVCDRFLTPRGPNASELQTKRASALKLIGEIYKQVGCQKARSAAQYSRNE